MSNAYNRPDQLSPQLRARVMEAARQMGYPGPDPVARSLRTRKAGAVGLLMTEQVRQAAECLGIALQDHVIVGNGRHTSFRREGLL